MTKGGRAWWVGGDEREEGVVVIEQDDGRFWGDDEDMSGFFRFSSDKIG